MSYVIEQRKKEHIVVLDEGIVSRELAYFKSEAEALEYIRKLEGEKNE